MAQVSLAWILSKEGSFCPRIFFSWNLLNAVLFNSIGVSAPIVGPTNLKNLEDLIGMHHFAFFPFCTIISLLVYLKLGSMWSLLKKKSSISRSHTSHRTSLVTPENCLLAMLYEMCPNYNLRNIFERIILEKMLISSQRLPCSNLNWGFEKHTNFSDLTEKENNWKWKRKNGTLPPTRGKPQNVVLHPGLST